MNKTVLEMEFRDIGLRSFKISLDDPRSDITSMEVRAVMEYIVENDVFKTINGKLEEVIGAKIVTTSVSELEV